MSGPTQALAALQASVRDAHDAGRPTRIVGGGTWLHGGRPVHATSQVDTRALDDVVAYVPGDLVITVGAGMSLAAIAEVAAREGQWLPLDPPGTDDATIGATVATASSGPLALGVGRVRDLVLGIASVTGEGVAVRAGGRVVKNVAGFDLVRLATGAFGTLGVITEVSLRLYARPAVDETLAVACATERDAHALLARLGLAAMSFLALELLDANGARAVLGDAHAAGTSGAEWTLLARVGGNRARADAVRALLDVMEPPRVAPRDAWHRLRALDVAQPDHDGPMPMVARVTGRPARLADTIAAVRSALADTPARLRATPHAGTVRVTMPPLASDAATTVVQRLRALGATGTSVLFEQLPASAWGMVPGSAIDSISRRIRSAFDPRGILNPGILGEVSAPLQLATT